MAVPARASLLLVLVAACGFPRPADVADDGNPSGDDSGQPGTTIHVAGTGDDSNDGITKPVKTLKHAIGLAAQNHQIASIILASDRYSTLGGETFPYTLPTNVTIVGSAGGGTVLAGSKAETGIMVDAGGLQDLEFEDFTAAIVATGMGRLSNIHVRTNMVAVRAETTAKLVADNLDITGAVGACATGIVLNGAADLMATTVGARSLGVVLDAKDQSTVSVSKASISGDSTCTTAVFTISTNKTFGLVDSLVDGGYQSIALIPRGGTLQATVVNTILRNARQDGIFGGAGTGGSTTLVMTGGEISNNGGLGAEIYQGSWTFMNVMIKQDSAGGIFSQGAGALLPGILKMRGCTIHAREDAINLFDFAVADLGTSGAPGNNSVLSSVGVGLDVAGFSGSRQIDAAGNVWRPNTQGADAQGKYTIPAVPISGIVGNVGANNYAIAGGFTIQLNPPLAVTSSAPRAEQSSDAVRH